MAWDTELVEMVRVLISDLDTTETFADLRLQQTIATAAVLVAQEVDLGQTYTITVSPSGTLTPDPTVAATRDNVAVALFPLKAACIIDTNKLQDATCTAIRVRDGDSEIDLRSSFKGYKDILEFGPCKTYEVLKANINANRAFVGEAILGPFRSAEFAINVPRFFDELANNFNRTFR